MRTFCIIGKSNSGKTLLVEQLVRSLSSKGYRVCTMKHTELERFDTKGKDTSRHLDAGALMTFGISKKESLAFFKHNKVEEIMKILPPIDFLIIEGGKGIICPKVLVGSSDVTNEKYIAKWKIGEPITKVQESIMALQPDVVQLYVDGKRINIKPFIQRAILSMLLGFVTSLKGVGSIEKELMLKINLKELSYLSKNS